MNWIRGKSYIWHDIYIYYIFTYFNMLECSPNRVCKLVVLVDKCQALNCSIHLFFGCVSCKRSQNRRKKTLFSGEKAETKSFQTFFGLHSIYQTPFTSVPYILQVPFLQGGRPTPSSSISFKGQRAFGRITHDSWRPIVRWCQDQFRRPHSKTMTSISTNRLL